MGKNSYKYDKLDLTGCRFGRLLVLGKAENGRSWWNCKCDCGRFVAVVTHRLLNQKSCGCLEAENKERLTDYTRTHGMTETKLYHTWCGMKERCYNPNYKYFDRYGGRGILVCDEWKNSFENFRDWAFSVGYEESPDTKWQSIDRINFDGNYEPSNCRWITHKEQMRNTSRTVYVEYQGQKIPLSKFCEDNGITYSKFVSRRIKKGVSAEQALIDWKSKVRVRKK
jgi:hypothetical protein